MHEAVHDSQVTNMVTHMVARTAGASLITPSAIEVWGLDEVTAEGPGGADAQTVLFTYAEDVEPSPEGNVPPLTDNDTHGNVRGLPAYLNQMGLFLEDGTVVQVCDGACDPD
jgi:hypothetical protein